MRQVPSCFLDAVFTIRDPTVIWTSFNISSRSTNFLTTLFLGLPLFLSVPALDFFCLTGEYPSRIFKRCSAIFRGTPVISAGFQAKISKFCLSKEHSSLRPFSVNVDPMATVCCRVELRWIAILFIFVFPLLFREQGYAGYLSRSKTWLSTRNPISARPVRQYISLCTRCPPISTSMSLDSCLLPSRGGIVAVLGEEVCESSLGIGIEADGALPNSFPW
ncbi:hypothetical protein Tco_1541609 [Tanacetum coccineum]